MNEREILGFHLYNGTLDNYEFGKYYQECGTDLEFLKHVTDKTNTYLVMTGDWSQKPPPKGYDTYIITNLGESENIDLVDTIKKYTGRKIIITSQHIGETVNTSDMTYFHMEHLHWYTRPHFKWFSKVPRKNLNQRQFPFGSLNRRADWHKEEILKHLLDNYPDLQYTWLEFPVNPSYQSKYNIPKRSIAGDQWSTDNVICNDCKLIWTNESLCNSHDNRMHGYLTEKIIKPIVSKSMFIMTGQRLGYTRLRGLGFETFEEYFGIDWDEEWDFERVEHTKNLISNFSFDLDQQDQVDYNYDYFYNKFFDVIDKRNTQTKEQILEFING